MKKLIVAVTIALVLLATQAFGGAYGNMMLGAKAGVNIASFHGDDVVNGKSIVGFVGGGFVELPINDMISFQPEVLYTMKGGKETEGGDLEVTWNLSYIEIPMLFKAYLPMAPTVKPHIYFGPEVAFRVSGTWEWEEFGETVEEDVEDVSNTDIGLVFGGGIAFPAMAHMFSLEARYDLGLTTIDDEDDPWDIKNGVFSILAGISF